MNDFQYTQQHLANERTYLAWVRTSITIVGLGFLAAGFIFKKFLNIRWDNITAAFIGIGSILLACIILVVATKNYLRKQKEISQGNFTPLKSMVYVVLVGLILLNLALLVLIVLTTIS
jgi:putative membrane protein